MANAGDHKPNDFTPVVGAMNLADYVLLITDNLKKFPDYSVKETVGAPKNEREPSDLRLPGRFSHEPGQIGGETDFPPDVHGQRDKPE